MNAVDVLIVGAGAAGLTVAQRLAGAGLRIAILEARNRIGGRILTRHDPLCSVPIELGAEFIHGHPPELWRVVEDARLTAIEVQGDELCRDNGQLRKCDDLTDGVDQILTGEPPETDLPFRDFLESRSKDRRRNDRIYSYIEGFNAANKSRISTLALMRQQHAEDEIQSDSLSRLAQGYDQVPLQLYRSIPDIEDVLHLNTPVSAIQWSPGKVKVTAGRGLQFRAARVVVTVPLGVLQSKPGDTGAIRFDPDPAQVRESISSLAMGHVSRTVLRFRERFWEAHEQLRGMSFLHAPGERMPTLWTQSPVRAPLLVAWAGGPQAGCMGDDAIESALHTLALCSGIEEGRLSELLATSYSHDWRSDPFSRGAYSYVPSGALDAVNTLSRPVEETLFFAGEATDTTGHWGTVHAAIRTGERAASQILRTC
jgi:monoamine oxidase